MYSSLFKRLLLLATVTVSLVAVSMSSLAGIQAELTSLQGKLAELEASSGGRIGISAINTANDMRLQYRAEERFPFCSTFKMMGVAAVLKKSMMVSGLLQQRINYKKEDLIVYSPVTEKHLRDGMTIAELCIAAIQQSDNTAIDLLIKKLGGRKAINVFAHSIGDLSFRLDRLEPELNSAIPGDVRDTSTPAAMEKSLQRLGLGNGLALPQRELLQTWLKGNTTGGARIRASVPKGWIVGDKTGTGDYGTTNDIAIIWPPKCPPIVVAIYFTQTKKDAAPNNEVIASATRLLLNTFARTDECIKKSS
ncbi:class A beta-lactamase [Legionella brunensis]|uniref:Beta-lactamase n=1 Tax=Legionella brunensis TaxID=29422 RepID=A0A0W0S039_9GAMM|nr:class A beta-lactamase [Legionella brunensis]KTC76803.1 Beta-lactamase OXY-1 precursor [Legionella brunensis]